MRPLSIVASLFALLTLATAQRPFERPLSGHVTRTESYSAIQINNYGESKPLDFACEKTTAPVAADTPNPFLPSGGTVVVDLVVGWDGKVYSPFLLERTSRSEDGQVMRALHSWRFHPATCNGVPVNAEGRITFKQ